MSLSTEHRFVIESPKFQISAPILNKIDLDSSETNLKPLYRSEISFTNVDMSSRGNTVLENSLKSNTVYRSYIELPQTTSPLRPIYSSTPQKGPNSTTTEIEMLKTQIKFLTEQCETLMKLVQKESIPTSTVGTQTIANPVQKVTCETQCKIQASVHSRHTQTFDKTTHSTEVQTERPILKESSDDKPVKTVTSNISTSKTNGVQNTDKKEGHTLIIGSSILQGISTRGLSKTTQVRTFRGANVSDIRQQIQHLDFTNFETIIIQVGGNDASSNRDLELVEEEFVQIVNEIRRKCERTTIYLSTVPPRRDSDVSGVNKIIRYVCRDYNVNLINVHDNFVDRNGVKRHLMSTDGIHLSNKGTAALLKTYHSKISVLKQQNTKKQIRCFQCGETGHIISVCHHRYRVKCWGCDRLGHKYKNCNVFN